MKTTPDFFFTYFVLGNYYDFKADPGDVRKAFNTVVSLCHMADHYYWFNKKHSPLKVESFNEFDDFRKFVSEKTEYMFQDVRKIANAYKHLYLKNNSETSTHTVASPGVVETITFQNRKSTITEIKEELSHDFKIHKVVYTRIDGQQLNIIDTIEVVISFWKNFLQQN